MNILVTGGAGFIGSHVCELLLSKGVKITVIDDLSTGYLNNLADVKSEISFIKSRIEDYEFAFLTDIDCVVHLAAQASVPTSISNFYESSKTNILSSIKIIDFCNNNKIPLVYASSSAIYGNLSFGDDTVSSQIDLLSPYAADKLALEQYAYVSAITSNLNSVGLRFFNVYGPRQDPKNPYSGVISIFTDRLLSNKNLYINGGNQTRDFIHVKDVAKIVVQAVNVVSKNSVCETVNVLTGKSVSIDALATKIMETVGLSVQKIYCDLPIGDPLESNGSVSKLKKLFNLTPSNLITLELGLRMTVEHMIKMDNLA